MTRAHGNISLECTHKFAIILKNLKTVELKIQRVKNGNDF